MLINVGDDFVESELDNFHALIIIVPEVAHERVVKDRVSFDVAVVVEVDVDVEELLGYFGKGAFTFFSD